MPSSSSSSSSSSKSFSSPATVFLFISIFILLLIVPGSTSSFFYLARYEFSKPIKNFINRNELSFTLYGYCFDSECINLSMLHNFDKLPTADEIIRDKKDLLIKRYINYTADSKTASERLSEMIQAFETFQPKQPTSHLNGIFSIPYLISLIVNIIACVLIYYKRKGLATLFLVISAILSLLGLIYNFNLYSWVFNEIEKLPELGYMQTNPMMRIASFNVVWLLVAILCLNYKGCDDRNYPYHV